MATKHCNSLFSNLINWLAWFWSPATLVLMGCTLWCDDHDDDANLLGWSYIHRRVSSCICGEVTWRHGCWCFGARGKLGSINIQTTEDELYSTYCWWFRNPAPANSYVAYLSHYLRRVFIHPTIPAGKLSPNHSPPSSNWRLFMVEQQKRTSWPIQFQAIWVWSLGSYFGFLCLSIVLLGLNKTVKYSC